MGIKLLSVLQGMGKMRVERLLGGLNGSGRGRTRKKKAKSRSGPFKPKGCGTHIVPSD
jgi:hypothetical protein